MPCSRRCFAKITASIASPDVSFRVSCGALSPNLPSDAEIEALRATNALQPLCERRVRRRPSSSRCRLGDLAFVRVVVIASKQQLHRYRSSVPTRSFGELPCVPDESGERERATISRGARSVLDASSSHAVWLASARSASGAATLRRRATHRSFRARRRSESLVAHRLAPVPGRRTRRSVEGPIANGLVGLAHQGDQAHTRRHPSARPEVRGLSPGRSEARAGSFNGRLPSCERILGADSKLEPSRPSPSGCRSTADDVNSTAPLRSAASLRPVRGRYSRRARRLPPS